MKPQFPSSPDVVIVGAGISGRVLGRLLVGWNLSVAVLEQRHSIARNQHFAGIVTAGDLETLGLGNLESMPLQNRVRRMVSIDRDHSSVPQSEGRVSEDTWTIVHGDLLWAIRRACDEHGVTFLEDATVSDLTWKNGNVSGVIAGPDHLEIRSRVVVLADESDPRLAEGPGFRPEWLPTQLMHVARERFEGTPARIQEGFGDGAGGVVCYHLVFTTSWGDPAEAFVVPASDSVTVAVAYLLEHEMGSARHVFEILEEIKNDPDISELLRGLDASDIVTEVVPVGSGSAPWRMVDGGILLVGDVVGATDPLNRDGLSDNLTVCDEAALAIVAALGEDDGWAAGMSSYQRFLDSALYRRRHRRFCLQGPRRDAVTWDSNSYQGLGGKRLAARRDRASGRQSKTLGQWSQRRTAGVFDSMRKSTKRQVRR